MQLGRFSHSLFAGCLSVQLSVRLVLSIDATFPSYCKAFYCIFTAHNNWQKN